MPALRYAPAVQDYIRTLAPDPKRALRGATDLLRIDARHSGLAIKQLRTRGKERFFRVRVGDYRIVYTPRPDHTYVWRIQHRSEGYGWLERLDPFPE